MVQVGLLLAYLNQPLPNLGHINRAFFVSEYFQVSPFKRVVANKKR